MPASGRRGRRPPTTSQSWGWHPLTDRWARRIVADACITSADLVLDVGAGEGALTRPLLATGARVIAVELHPRRLDLLQRLAVVSPALRVVRADAADLRLPRQPFRVVASPPYSVSSALLTRLLSRGSRLLSADLVLQRPLAARWVDGRAPGAQRWWREFDLEIVRPVPRAAFRRPPRVDSVVLRIRRW